MKLSKADNKVFFNLLELQSDDAILTAINLVRDKFFDKPEVIAHLANILAKSGKSLPQAVDLIADVASTGGPSSLSTLVIPLYLRAAGAIVPKLGVPGRPAGGIDCLAQIPGYRTTLELQDVKSILETVGYAHFLASGDFSPLDGKMFRLRQKHSAQAVPALVVSSLLSKKLSVGIKYAGLDIRVASHGNFGTDWITATKNAKLFRDTAEILDIKAHTVLTHAEYPYQPYIGRSEALVALNDFFENSASPWLSQHLSMCRTLAMSCVPETNREKIVKVKPIELRQFFDANLAAQGASPSGFDAVVEKTKKAHETELKAKHQGFCYFSLQEIRKIFVDFQAMFLIKGNTFPDPFGLILKCQPGDWVEKGETIASVRLPEDKKEKLMFMLEQVMCNPLPISKGPLLEVVDG